MKKTDTSRFLYHAQGIGLGGFLSSPADEALETQAAVSLPITGGYGRAASRDYSFHGFVSLREAHSYVSGKKSRTGIHETLVTSVVEGLNILDVVTADRIVARLVSSSSGAIGEQPKIGTIGSYFVNLRIKGVPVNVDLFDEPEPVKAAPPSDKKQSPMACLPMLRGLPHGLQRYETGPNSLYIPEFGSIYLGELIVSQESKRLTMLRVELGCSAQGSVSSGTVEGDGHQT